MRASSETIDSCADQKKTVPVELYVGETLVVGIAAGGKCHIQVPPTQNSIGVSSPAWVQDRAPEQFGITVAKKGLLSAIRIILDNATGII